MSDSTWNDPRITSYVLGELPEGELSAFESEIKSNGELATAVDQAREVTQRIGDLFEKETTPALDDARRESIFQGAAASENSFATLNPESPPADAVHGAPSWGVPMTVVAIAATLLLLVGFAPWMRQKTTVTAITSPTENETVVAQASPATDMTSDAFAMNDAQNSPRTAGNAVEETDVVGVATADLAVATNEPAAVAMADGISRSAALSVPSELPMSESVIPTADALGLPDLESLAQPDPAAANRGGNNFMLEQATTKEQSIASQDNPINRARQRISRGLGRGPIEAKQSAAAPVSAAAETAPTQPIASNVAKAAPELSSARPIDIEEPMTAQDALLFRNRPPETEFAEKPRTNQPAARISRAEDRNARGEGVETEKGGGMGGGSGRTRSLGGPSGPARRGTQRAKTNDTASVSKKTASQIDAEIRSLNEQLFGGIQMRKRRGDNATDEQRSIENEFLNVTSHPLSGFPLNVDSTSYRETRDALIRAGKLPDSQTVRVESFVNYFDYNYSPPGPNASHPFAGNLSVTACPWNEDHRLVRIAIQGKAMNPKQRPPCSLVFLLDTSGSMDAPNKLPLLVDGINAVVDQLSPKDKIAIIAYADAQGVVLDATAANKKKRIARALAELSGGGSTENGQGLKLAYHVARENLIADGANRVIMCTDGDFNAGIETTDELVKLVDKEAESGVQLTALCVGEAAPSDETLRSIQQRGKAAYASIQSYGEAKRALLNQTMDTAVVIAEDVRLKLEFNPNHVAEYRLIGYDQRTMVSEQSESENAEAENESDDAISRRKFHLGQSVTAFYEIVPVEKSNDDQLAAAEQLKYQREPRLTKKAKSDELLSVKLHYELPGRSPVVDKPLKVEFTAKDEDTPFDQSDENLQFAAAVAGFGLQLSQSQYAGYWTMKDVLSAAEKSVGDDPFQLRAEFLQVVRKAQQLLPDESN